MSHSLPSPSKSKIIEALCEALQREHDTLQRAADDARHSAIHSENKQENKYDTRGLEASYLALGQSQRAQELRSILMILKNSPFLDQRTEQEASELINDWSLVRISKNKEPMWVLIVPVAAGRVLKVESQSSSTPTVCQITWSGSPLGRELHGRTCDETFRFQNSEYEILAIDPK